MVAVAFTKDKCRKYLAFFFSCLVGQRITWHFNYPKFLGPLDHSRVGAHMFGPSCKKQVSSMPGVTSFITYADCSPRGLHKVAHRVHLADEPVKSKKHLGNQVSVTACNWNPSSGLPAALGSFDSPLSPFWLNWSRPCREKFSCRCLCLAHMQKLQPAPVSKWVFLASRLAALENHLCGRCFAIILCPLS